MVALWRTLKRSGGVSPRQGRPPPAARLGAGSWLFFWPLHPAHRHEPHAQNPWPWLSHCLLRLHHFHHHHCYHRTSHALGLLRSRHQLRQRALTVEPPLLPPPPLLLLLLLLGVAREATLLSCPPRSHLHRESSPRRAPALLQGGAEALGPRSEQVRGSAKTARFSQQQHPHHRRHHRSHNQYQSSQRCAQRCPVGSRWPAGALVSALARPASVGAPTPTF
jgi:hypothetical protein